jgi:two-component system cell cycle response regulator
MRAIVVDLSRFVLNFLVTTMQEAGLEVHAFASATEALDAMRDGLHPRLICTSLVTKDLSGLDFRRLVAANPSWSDVHMVLVTSSAGAEVEKDALASGFGEVFHKNDLQRFHGFLQCFLGARRDDDPLHGRILHVEDSAMAVEITRRIMEGHPVEIDDCPSVDAALQRIEEASYDLVITDYMLEGGKSGLDLVKALRKGDRRRIPVLVLSSIESAERKVEILESGANDFVSKPVVPGELIARATLLLQNKHLVDELESKQQLLYELAMRDQLTALFNRRSLFELAPKMIAEAVRHGYPISLFILDLDFFKRVNDNYGHQTGDAVLREIGALLQSGTREGDLACRFGGEEFVVLLPYCNLDDAAARSEELRGKVEDLIPAGVPLTACFGVSCLQHGWNFEALFHAADEAVYRAKAAGRNRVERGEHITGQISEI